MSKGEENRSGKRALGGYYRDLILILSELGNHSRVLC